MAADSSYPARFQVRQDGNAVVASGTSLDIESGGAFKIAGTDRTNQIARVAAPTFDTKSADFTVSAADAGKTFLITGVDKVATLPATAAGLRFTFVVASTALSAGTGFSVSPNAVDKIMGNGFTSADDKDAINSGASDREGDLLELTGDGVDGWYITRVIGTWARQA